MADKTAV